MNQDFSFSNIKNKFRSIVPANFLSQKPNQVVFSVSLPFRELQTQLRNHAGYFGLSIKLPRSFSTHDCEVVAHELTRVDRNLDLLWGETTATLLISISKQDDFAEVMAKITNIFYRYTNLAYDQNLIEFEANIDDASPIVRHHITHTTVEQQQDSLLETLKTNNERLVSRDNKGDLQRIHDMIKKEIPDYRFQDLLIDQMKELGFTRDEIQTYHLQLQKQPQPIAIHSAYELMHHIQR